MKRKWKGKSIFFLALALLISSPSYAHPGRTDVNGGHRDNQNVSGLGSYHYHCGGNPPHLHENGICPYNTSSSTSTKENNSNDTNTDYNNGSTSFNYDDTTSYKNNLSFDTEPSGNSGESNEYSRDSNSQFENSFLGNEADKQSVWGYVLFGAPFVVTVYILGKGVVINWTSGHKTAKKEQKEYEYYFSCYAFYAPEKFVNIPEGSYIKDGLPYSKSSGSYGIYTVYITPKGRRYHLKKNCPHTSKIKTSNVALVARVYLPCARCAKAVPDLSWYWEYKRIYNIKKKYGIP